MPNAPSRKPAENTDKVTRPRRIQPPDEAVEYGEHDKDSDEVSCECACLPPHVDLRVFGLPPLYPTCKTAMTGAVDHQMGRRCVERQSARRAECGRKGAALQHPSRGGSHIGWEPFPSAG
jgi:hypothetical protein